MNLNQWLDYLERLHPVTIDLGLDRVCQVADRLNLDFTGKTVITVGGTNGKGSCIALLDAILRAAGQRCGTYTSPHLLRYNERVGINGVPASDQGLCEAFAAVEAVREDISLTYFEFGTLAALVYFSRQPLDYVLLEVGLGGRLDAVNLVDADAAIVTNVALDHMDWLGDNRESIGHEKAGIYRSGRPAIYGERDMPDSVRDHARAIGARLYRQGEAFGWDSAASPRRLHWHGEDADGAGVEYRDLPTGLFAPDNIAAVLQALALTAGPLARETVVAGLAAAVLPGRFQMIERGGHRLLLDVAHNPHAAANLARSLNREFPQRRFIMVLAMLRDKDTAQVVAELKDLGVRWHVGEIANERAAPAASLRRQLLDAGAAEVLTHGSVGQALAAAEAEAGPEDIIVVTGSFFTVSAALETLAEGAAVNE